MCSTGRKKRDVASRNWPSSRKSFKPVAQCTPLAHSHATRVGVSFARRVATLGESVGEAGCESRRRLRGGMGRAACLQLGVAFAHSQCTLCLAPRWGVPAYCSSDNVFRNICGESQVLMRHSANPLAPQERTGIPWNSKVYSACKTYIVN